MVIAMTMAMSMAMTIVTVIDGCNQELMSLCSVILHVRRCSRSVLSEGVLILVSHHLATQRIPCWPTGSLRSRDSDSHPDHTRRCSILFCQKVFSFCSCVEGIWGCTSSFAGVGSSTGTSERLLGPPHIVRGAKAKNPGN